MSAPLTRESTRRTASSELLPSAFVAEMSPNPVADAVLDPVVPMTTAGAPIWRTAPQAVLVLAIASLLTVIRHTRWGEEAGP